jgi:hypothetical protein
VGAFGAVSAIFLGAGLWGYFFAKSFASDEQLASLPSYLIAGGAVLAGITIWIGTSSEPAVRVGAPGIAVEKGELRRMPWWAVDKITFDSLALAAVATGNDEDGNPFVVRVPVKVQPEAVGYLVKEALDRIPKRVEIDEKVLAELPKAQENVGQRVDLEPLQVVGRKCAATGKTISYEPDACVCTRCERVYVKTSVPKKCKCGNSLAQFRPDNAAEDGKEEADDEGEGVESTKEPAES